MSKNDQHARRCWGSAYDAIPKSVFATIAWHLANASSQQLDDPDMAFLRFFDELRALGHNGIIPTAQVLTTIRAFEKEGLS